MTPLSIQRVDGRGFTLYFFAFTAEKPPASDLTSVKNREWLYQRRYTLLEVQHLDVVDEISLPQGSAIALPKQDRANYAGTVISGMATTAQYDNLLMYLRH